MGALIRAFDWSATPVGPPDAWPQSLRLTVRLMLNSQHPMFIWWGPDLIQFYNDGYRKTMGPEMHPSALGAKGRESWADIWDIIGPQIDYVMAGKGATWNENQMVPIKRHGGVQEVWWTYGYSPIDLDGAVGGVLVVCTDVTRQHLYAEELRNRTELMARQFEHAPGFIAVLRGPDHVFEMANAAYRKLIGDRSVVGKPVVDALPEIQKQNFVNLLNEVRATGKPYVGRRIPASLVSDGSERTHYLDFIYQPIFEPDGTISGIFVEGQDVTDHVKVEKQLTVKNKELAHRVRNALTMVGAVANQSLSKAAGDKAMAAFHGRLQALGSAQDALTGTHFSGGDLIKIVELAIAPHRSRPESIVVQGPSISMGPSQAQSVSLALHELATNATKYGALSSDQGRVDLTWSSADGVFHLEWRESGGPPVKQPTRTGFGSRLIRMLAHEIGGELELHYDPDGFWLHLSASQDRLLTASKN